MSDGVKIALVAGGIAVVGYFLVTRQSSAPSVPKNVAPQNSVTAFISGIVPAFTSLISAAKGGPSAPANAPLAGISNPYTSLADASYVSPGSED
jgi:hypothetical protein